MWEDKFPFSLEKLHFDFQVNLLSMPSSPKQFKILECQTHHVYMEINNTKGQDAYGKVKTWWI